MNGWTNRHEISKKQKRHQGLFPSHHVVLEDKVSWEPHLKRPIPIPFCQKPFLLAQKSVACLSDKQGANGLVESGTGSGLRRKAWRMNTTSLETSYLSRSMARMILVEWKTRGLITSLIYQVFQGMQFKKVSR